MPVASILLQELERCKLRSGQPFGTRHPESTLLHLAHYRTTKDPPQGLDEPWTPGLILVPPRHTALFTTQAAAVNPPQPPRLQALPSTGHSTGTRGGSGRMAATKRSHRAQCGSRGLSPRPHQLPSEHHNHPGETRHRATGPDKPTRGPASRSAAQSNCSSASTLCSYPTRALRSLVEFQRAFLLSG